MVAKTWEGVGSYCLMSTEFQFGKMKNSLEMEKNLLNILFICNTNDQALPVHKPTDERKQEQGINQVLHMKLLAKT